MHYIKEMESFQDELENSTNVANVFLEKVAFLEKKLSIEEKKLHGIIAECRFNYLFPI